MRARSVTRTPTFKQPEGGRTLATTVYGYIGMGNFNCGGRMSQQVVQLGTGPVRNPEAYKWGEFTQSYCIGTGWTLERDGDSEWRRGSSRAVIFDQVRIISSRTSAYHSGETVHISLGMWWLCQFRGGGAHLVFGISAGIAGTLLI